MEDLTNQPDPNSPDNEPVTPPTPIVYESEEYRWEHKYIPVDLEEEDPLDEAALNDLGKEGWELTAVFPYDKTAHYYFKRSAEES